MEEGLYGSFQYYLRVFKLFEEFQLNCIDVFIALASSNFTNNIICVFRISRFMFK